MEGIHNSIWGPHFWATSHYITLSYPIQPTPEDKQRVKAYFELLQHLLPCRNCRYHYTENLKVNPLTDEILDFKLSLILWLINMHNYVNLQLGRNEMSVEDALVSLFTPQYSGIRVKQNADTNAKPLSHARIPYTIDRMKQTISTLILNYPENYIFDIDASIQEQVTARTNAALFEADLAHTKLSTHVIDKNIMETLSKHAQLKEYKHVTITKQPSIDFNIIMEKMQQHIEDNAHDPTLQKLIYSGLESLVLIFA